VNACEAYFIGRPGPEALAGVSLVFPLMMLMQTMSAGGMGGGIASATARALGAGLQWKADALVWHALAIAVCTGTVFTTGALGGGPWIYRLMGGTDGALAAAFMASSRPSPWGSSSSARRSRPLSKLAPGVSVHPRQARETRRWGRAFTRHRLPSDSPVAHGSESVYSEEPTGSSPHTTGPRSARALRLTSPKPHVIPGDNLLWARRQP
jgi:MatE